MQTPGGNISRLVANFPNFHFAEIDGTDAIASYAAMSKAAAHIRAGNGPAFVHGHVVRPYSHSLSDDERLYRPATEREDEAKRDPLTRLQMLLLREGILDEEAINKLEKEVEEEVQEASDRAACRRVSQAGQCDRVRVFAGPGPALGGVSQPAEVPARRARQALAG